MALYEVSHTAVDVGTTTIELAAGPNSARRWLLLQNISSVDIFIKFGVAAVVNEGIMLTANGGAFEVSAALGNADIRAINGIAASGATNRVLVSEGIEP